MYFYIKGTVKNVETSFIVLENNNIGYLIYVANPYSFVVEKEYVIYIYQHVREDEISLYGFKNKEERDLFLKLINVKGLGCKMALPMIATGSISGIIDAIERENILYLKKFPKIGDKVARQIILDLKGKLVDSSTSKTTVLINEELVETLKALGYKNSDINKILPKVDYTKTIEEQVKDALKLFLK
ncbi:MAG: Holliday junction branch migration protein RuvA [Bacilli bacterium]|nr:Holliday junction branch migration protein RuvA [Bacilli bacterium]